MLNTTAQAIITALLQHGLTLTAGALAAHGLMSGSNAAFELAVSFGIAVAAITFCVIDKTTAGRRLANLLATINAMALSFSSATVHAGVVAAAPRMDLPPQNGAAAELSTDKTTDYATVTRTHPLAAVWQRSIGTPASDAVRWPMRRGAAIYRGESSLGDRMGFNRGG